MSLLTYNRLKNLPAEGVIDALIENINGGSIDIRLGPIIRYETKPLFNKDKIIRPKIDDPFKGIHDLRKGPYILEPGEMILAESVEVFNLPRNLFSFYKLKSTLARIGLNHALAGWCDGGWHSSTLTLELFSCLRFHHTQLSYEMPIGQMIFWEGEKVPSEHSYDKKGQYNNQSGAQGSKGVR